MTPKHAPLCKKDTRSFREKHSVLIHSVMVVLFLIMLFALGYAIGDKSIYSLIPNL